MHKNVSALRSCLSCQRSTNLVDLLQIHRSRAEYECSRGVTSTTCGGTLHEVSHRSNCPTAGNLESFATCTCPRMRAYINIHIQTEGTPQRAAEGARQLQGCHHVSFCCSSSSCKLPGFRSAER